MTGCFTHKLAWRLTICPEFAASLRCLLDDVHPLRSGGIVASQSHGRFSMGEGRPLLERYAGPAHERMAAARSDPGAGEATQAERRECAKDGYSSRTSWKKPAAKRRSARRLERSCMRAAASTNGVSRKSSDVVDLIDALGKHEFAVAYAAATIDSPEAKTRLVGLGSDDGVRVWLNGELVHENPDAACRGSRRRRISHQAEKGHQPPADQSAQRPRRVGLHVPLPLARNVGKAVVQSGVRRRDGNRRRSWSSLGVDVDARSAAGITAAQIAKVRGHDQLADFLVSKGAASPQPFDAGRL